jgi:8-oxo-dGTP diphosphatase
MACCYVHTMCPIPHLLRHAASSQSPGWPDIGHAGVLATACYIRRDNKVLLQLKAPRKFGGDRWNAPGGKLEPDEDPETAVIREVREETGLAIESPAWHGSLTFAFNTPERYRLTSHIFSARDFTGNSRGSAEGRLHWFPEGSLPWDKMWVDDRYWLPAVLDGAYVRGLCVFADDEGRTLADFRLAVRWPSRARGQARA